MRCIALTYLSLIVIFPVTIVLWRTFEDGIAPVIEALTEPHALTAIWLTVFIALIAVPLNTVFGILCALVLVRQDFRGKGLFNAAIDLPLGVSPVVIGLALIIVYGRNGWFGGWLIDHGIQVIFSTPGMIHRNHLRLTALRRPRGDASLARSRHRSGAGRQHAWGGTDPDVSPHHAPVDSGRHRLWGCPDDGARDWGVRRCQYRVRQDRRPNRDDDALC